MRTLVHEVRRSARWAVLAVAVLVAGCGMEPTDEALDEPGAAPTQGSGTPAPWCRLEGRLSGALAEDVAWDRARGCGAVVMDEERGAVTLSWANPHALLFELTIAGMPGPRTGRGLAATVSLRRPDHKTWTTAMGGCEVDVKSFSFEGDTALGRRYRITGTGRCSRPATGADASDQVVVGDFSFLASALL